MTAMLMTWYAQAAVRAMKTPADAIAAAMALPRMTPSMQVKPTATTIRADSGRR